MKIIFISDIRMLKLILYILMDMLNKSHCGCYTTPLQFRLKNLHIQV